MGRRGAAGERLPAISRGKAQEISGHFPFPLGLGRRADRTCRARSAVVRAIIPSGAPFHRSRLGLLRSRPLRNALQTSALSPLRPPCLGGGCRSVAAERARRWRRGSVLRRSCGPARIVETARSPVNRRHLRVRALQRTSPLLFALAQSFWPAGRRAGALLIAPTSAVPFEELVSQDVPPGAAFVGNLRGAPLSLVRTGAGRQAPLALLSTVSALRLRRRALEVPLPPTVWRARVVGDSSRRRCGRSAAVIRSCAAILLLLILRRFWNPRVGARSNAE